MANGMRDLVVQWRGVVDKSFKNATDQVERAVGGIGDQTETAEKRTRKSGDGMLSTFKKLAVGMGVLKLVDWGKDALMMGLDVAKGNEQAAISFETMLGSAEAAQKFLADMKKFAAATPFEMPELQTAASSLISVGISADKVLPIMKTLGDTTSGMGTGSEGIKRATVALQQMNAAGRITGEDLNQLRDAGIPVFDLLAAATGKSVEQVAELAQKGKLGKQELEQLMSALESGKGLERFAGLMDKQSESLEGMLSTFQDVLGQGMAEVMEPFIPIIKSSLGWLSDTVLPAVISGAQWAGDTIAGLWDKLRSGNAEGPLGDVVDSVRGIWESAQKLGPVFTDVWNAFKPLADDLKDLVGGALLLALDGLEAGFGGLVDTLSDVAGWMSENKTLVSAFGAAVLGAVAAFGLWKTVTTAASIATKAWAAAQALFNAVMAANPIMLIVLAVGALVAAFIYLWNNCEPFKKFFLDMWDAIKGAASAVADWFTGTLVPWIQGVWDKITSGAQWLWDETVRIWDGIVGAITGAWDSTVSAVTGAINTVKTTISNGWTAVTEGVTKTWDGIKTGISNAWTGISTATSNAMTGLKDGMARGWDAVQSGAGQAWDWMKNRASDAWEKGIKPAAQLGMDGMRWLISVGQQALSGDWSGAWDQIKGIVDRAWQAIKGFVDRHLGGLTGLVRTGMDVVKDAIWKPIDWAKTKISELLSGIERSFELSVDAVSRIWDGMKSAAGSPVKFVVDTVFNNGLLKAWNTVAGWVGLKKMDPLPVPRFEHGGIVPGSRSRGIDSTLAIAADGTPLARVDPGEHLTRYRSVLSMERHHPGALDYINRKGRLPGYAGGGRVRPVNAGHSGWNGGRYRRGGYHGGLDFPVPTGTPVRAFMDGVVTVARHMNTSYGNHLRVGHGGSLSTLYAHNSALLAGVGQAVKAGQVIARSGSTGNSTGPHLHFEVRNPGRVNPEPWLNGSAQGQGATVGPAGDAGSNQPGVVFSAIRSAIDGALGPLAQITDNPIGKLVAGVPRKLANDLVGMAEDAWNKAWGGGDVLPAPKLYDRGGWLNPGLNLVENRTGKPEPVLTDEQLEALLAGRAVEVHVHVDDDRLKDLVRVEISDHDRRPKNPWRG